MKSVLCVIPAAGNSTRMGEMCKDLPKWALEIDGRPILDHVLSFWHRYADSFKIVVQPRFRTTAFDIIHRGGWSGTAHISEIANTRGVPDTVLHGLEATGCPKTFIVALADCLFDGEFEAVDLDEHGKLWHGIAVAESGIGDWDRSYVAELAVIDEVSGVRVRSLIEKPALGLGAYWLRWTALRAIEETRDQPITETLAVLLKDDHPMKPVRFQGPRYINVTYPEDLERW